MKAVILAAGLSTRTHPLTLTRPKPLLMAAGRTILEHNLRQLEGLAEEAILITGYRDRQIKSFVKKIKKDFKFKISTVRQKEQLGTGHAASQVEDMIDDKFLVMGGDDFFSEKDIKSVIKHRYAVLAQEVKNPSRYGVFVTKNKKVRKLVEKPEVFVSNLANTGLYVFDQDIFGLLKDLNKSKRDEYEITDAVGELAKKEDVMVERVKDYWIPIGYPWDLLRANRALLKDLKKDIQGKVEKGAVVKGKLSLGKGSTISKGAYLEGPVYIGRNCRIKSGAYLKGPVSIGDECEIRNAEVKESVVFQNTKVGKKANIDSSVVGSKVMIGDLTKTSEERPDQKNILSEVKGELVDTGRKKLGTVMGDSSVTGFNTVIYPGRKVWPKRKTRENMVVKEDIN